VANEEAKFPGQFCFSACCLVGSILCQEIPIFGGMTTTFTFLLVFAAVNGVVEAYCYFKRLKYHNYYESFRVPMEFNFFLQYLAVIILEIIFYHAFPYDVYARVASAVWPVAAYLLISYVVYTDIYNRWEECKKSERIV